MSKVMIEIEDSEHSIYSASAAYRTLACPGAIKAESNFESKTNAAATLGTAIHYLGARFIDRSSDREHHAFLYGLFTENGIKITRGMCLQALDYANYIIDLSKGAVLPYLMIEAKVEYNDIVEGGFGTADAIYLDYKNKTLHVVDLKTGKHKVSPEGNYQMALYAIGAINKMDGFGEIENIVMHIYQPNANNISKHSITYDKLMEFKAWAKRRWAISQEENPPLIPSFKSCQWCLAKSKCPAKAQKRNMKLEDGMFNG